MKVLFTMTVQKLMEIDTTQDTDEAEVTQAQFQDQPEDIFEEEGEIAVDVKYIKLG